MVRLFVQHLAIYNIENLPNSITKLSLFQICKSSQRKVKQIRKRQVLLQWGCANISGGLLPSCNHLCIKHFLVVVQLWYVATNYLKKGLKYAHIDSWILQMEMYRRDLWRWVKRSILGRVGYILWPSSILMFADNRIRRVNLFAYHSVWNKGPWKVFHWHATCMLKCPAVVVAQLGKMSAVRVLSSNFNLPTYCRLYWKTNLKKKEAGKGLKQGLKDTESNQSNRMER